MEEYTLKPCIEPPVENRFAPSYDIENDVTTIAELKQAFPENRYTYNSTPPEKSNTLPRVTIIEGDDLSSLNEKQLFWLEKIEKLKSNKVFEKIAEDKKTDKPVSAEPINNNLSQSLHIADNNAETEKATPIIPPFKEGAPFAESVIPQQEPAKNESILTPEKSAPPIIEETLPQKRLKRLSADEILALHKKDFAEKKFKPSFITVSEANEEENENVNQAERLAELYYASNTEEYSEPK